MDSVATMPEPHELRVLDQTGDTKVIWNPAVADEVAVARQSFDTLKRKGYLAYRVNRGGEKGEVIREFDPRAEAIILAPPTVGG